MKVVVTGAAGFIGSHLSERLKSLGHEVVGLDNFCDYYNPELKKQNAADLKEKGIEVYTLDLAKDLAKNAVESINPSEESPLQNLLQGAEVIYHLAAQPGISSTVPFEYYLNNNIVATYNLLEAARALPTLKMFINIATSSIYGSHATNTEDTAAKPTSYYGVTKLAAEQLALAYCRDKGFPACSTRLFSVYGERERPEKLYPKLIDCILEDKPFPLFEGSEKHLRSYTYVGDIIDGLIAVLSNLDKCKGEIFNLGIDSVITTGEGIKIVEEILGKKAKLDIRPKRAGDQTETHANIDKARKVLGYNPTTTPQDGLRKEVEWYKEKIWKKINLYQ